MKNLLKMSVVLSLVVGIFFISSSSAQFFKLQDKPEDTPENTKTDTKPEVTKASNEEPSLSPLELPPPMALEGGDNLGNFFVVSSPSLEPGLKEKVNALAKQNGLPLKTLPEAMSLNSRDKVVLVGEFTLSESSILNGQFMGLTPALAEMAGVAFTPTVLNVTGPVSLKNETVLKNMKINLEADLIMEDYSQLKDGEIHINKGSVFLNGKPHTVRVTGVHATCRDDFTRVAFGQLLHSAFIVGASRLSGEERDVLNTSSERLVVGTSRGTVHAEFFNNEIDHCDQGIVVFPGSHLTATLNNIHHTVIGVVFSRGCGGSVRPCPGDISPPSGELSENIFSQYRIGVFVESGRPDISNLNRFETGQSNSESDKWISLVNMSTVYTTLHPLRYLLALNNNWSLPIRDPSTILHTTTETYGRLFSLSSLITNRRNPKNIVNLGAPGATVENRTIAQTIAVGCSLVRDEN